MGETAAPGRRLGGQVSEGGDLPGDAVAGPRLGVRVTEAFS